MLGPRVPSRSWLVFAALALVVAAAPASAQLGDHCSNVCTETTSCDTPCRTETGPEQPGEEWSTCGDWGVCDPGGGSCEPDWEVIDTESMGGFSVNHYTYPATCDFYSTYLITERDMNQCGEPDRTWCWWQLTATRNDHFCCNFWNCSPNACHQP